MSRRSKPTKKGVLHKLRAKTQSATIHLTTEDDWETEVPNVKLSRIFAIVLLLHVVAVGGILAFQLLNGEEGVAEPGGAGGVAEAEAKAESGDGPSAAEGRETPAGDLLAGVPEVPKIGGPEVQGLRHYRVQSGDSLMAIARRFAVPVVELEKLNGMDAGNKLYPGLILYLPNRQIRAESPRDVETLLAQRETGTYQPANKRETPGTRVPLARNEADGVPVAAAGAVAPVRHPVAEPVPVLGNAPVAEVVDAGVPVAEVVEPGEVAAAAAASAPEVAAAAGGARVRGVVKLHKVEPGETAYAIGRQYGIAADELLRMNDVEDARLLQVGQVLKVVVAE